MTDQVLVGIPAGDLAEFRELIVAMKQIVSAATPTPDVMGRSLAMIFTAKHSDSAFDRWCNQYGVKPLTRGRYSKASLQIGLNREQRGRKP